MKRLDKKKQGAMEICGEENDEFQFFFFWTKLFFNKNKIKLSNWYCRFPVKKLKQVGDVSNFDWSVLKEGVSGSDPSISHLQFIRICFDLTSLWFVNCFIMYEFRSVHSRCMLGLRALKGQEYSFIY
jgi:hypothetical protein